MCPNGHGSASLQGTCPRPSKITQGQRCARQGLRSRLELLRHIRQAAQATPAHVLHRARRHLPTKFHAPSSVRTHRLCGRSIRGTKLRDPAMQLLNDCSALDAGSLWLTSASSSFAALGAEMKFMCCAMMLRATRAESLTWLKCSQQHVPGAACTPQTMWAGRAEQTVAGFPDTHSLASMQLWPRAAAAAMDFRALERPPKACHKGNQRRAPQLICTAIHGAAA